MKGDMLKPGEQVVIPKLALGAILDVLRDDGYKLIGPTIREGAITYDEIERLDDLPIGWRDEQSPATYRLTEHKDETYFCFVVGPDSPKKYLYPSKLPLFKTRDTGRGPEVQSLNETPPRFAFIGIRSCDIAAMDVQDQVFIEGPFMDHHYVERRAGSFIFAVNCTNPQPTCFCASMGTGPKCSKGFDLAATELKDCFLIEVGSPLGARALDRLDWRLAGTREIDLAAEAMAEAEDNMGRCLITDDLPHLLLDNLDHPRWDDVAERCLSCTNCTMVCPTCFCSDVEDGSDLQGKETARIRVWDSCFSPDFSHVYGGQIRPNVRSRYRQWLTHKLASWIGQFDVIGCVGCGRCITWCPAGIDLREEVAAIRGEV
jgi:ferredoxin